MPSSNIFQEPVFAGARRVPADRGYTVYIFRDGERDLSAHRGDVADCEIVGTVWHDYRHSCRWDVSVFVRDGWLSQVDYATGRRPIPERLGKGHADVSNTRMRTAADPPDLQGESVAGALPVEVQEWLVAQAGGRVSGVDVLDVGQVYELMSAFRTAHGGW